MRAPNTQPHSWIGVLVACLMVASLAGDAVAFPEPSPVTRYWQYDFSVGQPRLIAVRDAEGQPRWYWFVPYKVQNNTGEDRLFIPEVTVATDAGHVIQVEPTLSDQVFQGIIRRLGNNLLEHPSAVVDTLLQGPDHARESVICWPAPDGDVDRYRVFVSGLSGEIKKIINPNTGETVVMRKTLMLQYTTPGSSALNKDQPIVSQGQRWIMR